MAAGDATVYALAVAGAVGVGAGVFSAGADVWGRAPSAEALAEGAELISMMLVYQEGILLKAQALREAVRRGLIEPLTS